MGNLMSTGSNIDNNEVIIPETPNNQEDEISETEREAQINNIKEHCKQALKSSEVSSIDFSTRKVVFLRPHAIAFAAYDHSQYTFMHDYGDHTPSTSGIWNTKTSSLVNLREGGDLKDVWNFSVKLTVDLAVTFLETVLNYSDIVKTKKDVEDAHEAYGGRGKSATLPYLEGNTIHFWTRGRVCAIGVPYSRTSFSFPTK